MTTADAIFAAAQGDIFAALGTDATVQRGANAAVPVRVVVTDSEETTGQHSQRIGNERHLQFIKAAWDPKAGDLVTIAGVAQRVHRIVKDDGHVVEVVVHG